MTSTNDLMEGITMNGYEAQVTELRTRVSAVEGSLQRVEGLVVAIGTKLDAKSQTPWAVIWSAAGVIVAILLGVGTALYAPVARDIERLSVRIDKQDDGKAGRSDFERLAGVVVKLDDTTISRADLETRLTTSSARRDDWQRASEEKSRSNAEAITKLQGEIVSRGENAEHWREVDNALMDKQRQIDELRTRSEALYGPRDELTRLSKDLDDLRSQLLKIRPQ